MNLRLARNSDPKKLNLAEMWRLYQVLSPHIHTKMDGTLISEVHDLSDAVPPQTFLIAMRIMYGRDYNEKSPIKVASMFINGLRENNFFSFAKFIRKDIIGGVSK